MRTQPRAEFLVGVLALSLLLPSAARSQASAGPIRPPAAAAEVTSSYPDTADGLRLFLMDVLASAKSGQSDKLAAFIKNMEIPSYETWFTATFGQEKGESWAKPYGDDLDKNDEVIRRTFVAFGQREGNILTRKVNGAPQPGHDLESGMVQSLKQPVDIYFAAWKAADAQSDSKYDPIGYFVFIDGKFRWNSTINVMSVQRLPVQQVDAAPAQAAADQPGSASSTASGDPPALPGRNGVGYPSCVYCPAPAYTRAARAAKIEGSSS